MQSVIMPIMLQFAGVAIILAEIFIPSGGLLGLTSAGLFGYSLYLVFTDVSTTAGIYFLTADIIGVPFLLYFGVTMLSRSSATLNQTLSSQEGFTAQNPRLASFIQQRGVALADLRPSGPALINNHRIDVVSRGEYINKGSELIVVDVTGNQILVKKQTKKGENA